MAYTLLLIDLQPGFTHPDPDFLHIIENLIEQAIEDKAYIVLCEFDGHGSTWKEIRDKLQGYKNKCVVRKKGQDGGVRVARKLNKLKKHYLYEILVGGLYTEMCVKDTVTTLAEIMQYTQFTIIKQACMAGLDPSRAWRIYDYYLRKMDNLELK